MTDPVDLGFAVKLPPRQAIRYFQSKGYAISWNWWETWQAAHAKAFTVAKATRLDVLQTIRGGLDRALRDGTTERTFLKEMEPALRKAGWWGQQTIVDSAGNAEVVQLGSPHRLKTIFRTNLRTAYAHGRYRRQAANARSRPFWMYDAVNDARTRPSHAALDGRVFRHNDPFWDTHYPPNGWGCRCRVRALTQSQVEKRGLTVSRGQRGLYQVEQKAGFDKRTGEEVTTEGTEYRFRSRGKRHTLLPDPGWSYNPGKASPLYDLPADGDLDLWRLADTRQKTWQDFGLPKRVPAIPAPPRLAPADTPEAAKRQIAERLSEPGFKRIGFTRADGKKDVAFNRVETPEGLEDVLITESFVDHLVDDHPSGRRERFADHVLPSLRDPAEVWLTAVTDPQGRTAYRRRFLTVFDDRERKENTVAITQEDKDGSLSWTFYPARSVNGLRKGFLLYRRPEGG